MQVRLRSSGTSLTIVLYARARWVGNLWDSVLFVEDFADQITSRDSIIRKGNFGEW